MSTRSGRARLWRQIGELFDTDDGSLPEVQIVGVGSAANADAIYRALIRLGEPLSPDAVVAVGEREVRLRELPDAGLLAAFGIIESLHLVLSGVAVSGQALPDLGVRIDYGGLLSIDYRQGPDWNPEVLAAFIELINDLSSLTPGASLLAADPSGSPLDEDMQARFNSAIADYLAGD